MSVSKKNVLIVAGSDSVGGAGVQADIKSCEAFGCFSASVITAVTAQNTNGVSSVLAMPASMVKAQFEMVLAELDIDAVKVGMLFNEEIIAVVSGFLKELRAKNVPVVIDPVCVAKSGAKLLEDGAIEALKELLNLASVATPNADEARILGINFTNLKFVITPASENVAESAIYYGKFFQSIVDFLIIAISVFFFVRLISLAKKKEEIVEKVAEPVKTNEVLLLEEIRDLLKK